MKRRKRKREGEERYKSPTQREEENANNPKNGNAYIMISGRSSSIWKNKMSLIFLSIILLHIIPFSISAHPPDEAISLTNFKASLIRPKPDPLAPWSVTSTMPTCSWPFVLCAKNILVGLNLGELNLTGTIDVESLSKLRFLRSISFVNNSFSGPMPPFSKLDGLKSLYLSNNKFSGPIPDDFFNTLARLKKLELQSNAFSGTIPSSLAKLTILKELKLQDNNFEGAVPDFNNPSLSLLNVSNNQLTGPIPDGLAKKFNVESFQGNPNLCGPPLSNPCAVQASQSNNPPPADPPPENGGMGKTSVIMILGLIVIIGIFVGLSMARNRKTDPDFDKFSIEADAEAIEAVATVAVETNQKQINSGGSSHKRGGSSRGGSGSKKGGGGGGGGGGGTDLVMVNEDKGLFGVADLMKAAAEVLGNGGLGSAYKVVMPTGVALAVKRMREMNRSGKEAFDSEMRRYGAFRHKNVLPPLAYLYRREEKLIVSEYVSKGSLLYILHGDRGRDHAALDWPTRLKIILGITRGMTFLHSELLSLVEVPHGNLKSGNILLASDFEPLIVDYGFLNLVNPAQAIHALFAYKSPEAINQRQVSHKSDIYCLGVVILEILTGKFPSQYLNNTKGGTDVVKWAQAAIKDNREAELLDPDLSGGGYPLDDMIALLRLGTTCAGENSEGRPEMNEVVNVVEDVMRRNAALVPIQKQESKIGRMGSTNQRASLKRIESSAGRAPAVYNGESLI